MNVYLKEIINEEGKKHYSFVRKFLWGLITVPVYFYVVKRMGEDTWEIYKTQVRFTSPKIAKTIASYFLEDNVLVVKDTMKTMIHSIKGVISYKDTVLYPVINRYTCDEKYAYVSDLYENGSHNDIWWWCPEYLQKHNYEPLAKLPIKFVFFWCVKICGDLENVLPKVSNYSNTKNSKKHIKYVKYDEI